METLQIFLLGVIQGLTEFLPVSSSGHLILAQTFLGMDAPDGLGAMSLEIVLHVGTGFAVLAVFWKDIMSLLRGWFSRDTLVRDESLRYCGYIILATIPAAIIGIFFSDFIERLFDTSRGNGAAYLAASMLLVTAGLLFYSSRKNAVNNNAADKNVGDKNISDKNIGGKNIIDNNPSSSGLKIALLSALIIGLTQAVAITPGISRSGSTIAVALILGVSRLEAGKFSFMLAIPAIFGAALLDLRKLDDLSVLFTLDMIIGFAAAFAVGLFALKCLLSFVRKGKLFYFGYYCVAVSVVSILVLTFIF